MPRQAKTRDPARRLLKWDASWCELQLAARSYRPEVIERAIAIESAKSRPRRKICRVLAKYLPGQ